MRSLVLIVAALVFLLTALSNAKAENSTMQVLNELAQSANSVQSVQADFRQEKHLSIFNEVAVTKGLFAFQRPDSLRWEYTEPFASGFVLQGNKATRFGGTTGTQETDLESDPALSIVSEQVMAWTTFDLDRLTNQFAMELDSRTPLRIKLVPHGKGLREVIPHLLVTFAQVNAIPTVSRVELHDADGDFTRIDFTNTILNETLSRNTFRP